MQRRTRPPPREEEEVIDWTAVGREVTGYLQDLIRIDTRNPPGNESEAARYLAGVLEREGFETAITESAPGRGNVTTRLEGGGDPPLLLLGHTDVVAVEADQWMHPPFGGELHDGYVWGRGALDMKNMVVVELMVMLLLRRHGQALNRTVLFAATADEEAGKGDHGPGWLLDHHPEQIEAPVILTEGAGHDLQVGRRRFYTCQVCQKGICRMRVTARGLPGHGSVPHSENAVVRLCRAMGGLDGVALPVHQSATLTAFLEGLAQGQPSELARLLRQVVDPEGSEAALKALPLEEEFKASLRSLLRNTASVTMLSAGTKINVIPAEATAFVDGRLAPQQSAESFVAELRTFIGTEVEIEVEQYSPPLDGSSTTPFYRAIEEVMEGHDPGVPVIPSLSTGGTDAKHICPRRPGTEIYGFMPYRQSPGTEEMRLIHGHDERTSVANLLFATKVIFDLVCRYGGAPGARMG